MRNPATFPLRALDSSGRLSPRTFDFDITAFHRKSACPLDPVHYGALFGELARRIDGRTQRINVTGVGRSAQNTENVTSPGPLRCDAAQRTVGGLPFVRSPPRGA
jgi:hypothetical protein